MFYTQLFKRINLFFLTVSIPLHFTSTDLKDPQQASESSFCMKMDSLLKMTNSISGRNYTLHGLNS